MSSKRKTTKPAPQVGILMGSDSDWSKMKAAADACAEFGVAADVHAISAHRNPQAVARFARNAESRGIGVIIAGAGLAAHLPGVVASMTTLPVIGVPISAGALQGQDALLAIVQMPPGVPVASVAVDGARNAGLLAVQILATASPALRRKFADYKKSLVQQSKDKDKALQKKL